MVWSAYSKGPAKFWAELGRSSLSAKELVYPVFVCNETNKFEEIPGFLKQYRLNPNYLCNFLEPLAHKGLETIALFGTTNQKDIRGSLADHPKGPIALALKNLKKYLPNLTVATDVCLCGYTETGSCGIIDQEGHIDNAATIDRLAEISVAHSLLGADIVAPSDMMDNRVDLINKRLIENQLRYKTHIMSYSAKFSSSFYGPFRSACKSNSTKIVLRPNQLPPGSVELGLQCIKRDLSEGADYIIVKPGLPYLDVISRAKREINCHVPIVAYQTSGEYMMLVAGSQAGAFELDTALLEIMTSFKRAGCSAVITYFTPQLLNIIKQ